MKHGEYTGQLGERLAELFRRQSDITVYYDHGKSSLPNVCKPTPYFGDFSAASTLANVDLVVVQNDQVTLLCEIEEEGGSPKKIIGDVCNVLLAEKIRIKDKDYPLEGFHFILGMKLPEKGKGTDKLEALEKRMSKLVRPELLKDRTIQFIHANSGTELIDKVQTEICRIIGLVNPDGH